jgi:hypothetical protein
MECLPHNPCKPPPPSTGLYSYARHSCTLGSPGLSLLLDYTSAWHSRPTVVKPLEIGMHVFWTWAPFFWTCTCFLDLPRIFLDLGSQKMWGTCLCVFWTLWGFFLDLHVFVLDPGIFFSTAKLIVSELGFCFLDPCTCFVDLVPP